MEFPTSYKSLWKITGPIILDSWKDSAKTNTLPQSHFESVITLFPKDGKDIRDIKIEGQFLQF